MMMMIMIQIGSFQFSTHSKEESPLLQDGTGNVGKTASCQSTFKTYLGTFGSSKSTSALVETLQGAKLSTTVTPNPVSLAHAEELTKILIAKMDMDVPCWLKDAPEVIAIGGDNSIFQLCCSILTIIKQRQSHSDDNDSEKVESFSAADILLAINECVDRSDEYLQQFVQHPYPDPVSIVIPKLALLYAVMLHTGIQRVKAVVCIGSCAGMLITDRLYSKQ